MKDSNSLTLDLTRPSPLSDYSTSISGCLQHMITSFALEPFHIINLGVILRVKVLESLQRWLKFRAGSRRSSMLVVSMGFSVHLVF